MRITIATCCTLLLPFVGCGQQQSSPATPSETRGQQQSSPATQAETQDDAARELWVRSNQLARRPVVWEKHADGDFFDWFFEQQLVPEILPVVREWLEGGQESIDVVVTNKPTGSKFRVVGRHDDIACWCKITWIPSSK